MFFSSPSPLRPFSPSGPCHQKENFLPVSVWYSGGKARAPMLSPITPQSREEWKRDLEQIKSLGFNSVRTWVEWAHCEPLRGEYRFDNLELLCRLAEEQNLRVLIQMYVDSAPDWVPEQYPEALFEAQSGEKVLPQAAPGCCVDHPGVAEAVARFYTETARVAVRYPCFFGWDLWSEPHILNWVIIQYVPNAQFCFCAGTRLRFRQWLQAKYGSLDELNRSWYRNFHSWDQVEPPRFGTILSYTDFIDWKNFIYTKMTEDLRIRYEAIRKADQTHVITSHAAVPSIFYSPVSGWSGYGITDDFLMADQVDYYGTSLYPKHSFPNTHWQLWKFQAAIDFSRSANRKNGGFYVGELQAGQGTRGVVVGDPVTAEDHRLWFWPVIAGGARGVNFFAYYPMSSGYESGGYGLIQLDGTLTDRARQTGRLARLVDENKDLFLNTSPVPAEVAILYNPLAQMVGGEQNSGPENGHRDSLFGYWQVLNRHHIPFDFIHRRDLEQGDALKYKLLIIPYPLMFTQKAAEGLKSYIASGGCVVSEARLAWNDERGYASETIPGMGLAEVFGVRESRVKMEEEVIMKLMEFPHPKTTEFSLPLSLKGAYFSESIEPIRKEGTKILARHQDDSPAIVASEYEKGKTILIGSFLGLACYPDPGGENTEFILNLLDWAKVDPPFTCSIQEGDPDLIDIRMTQGKKERLLFILNHGTSGATVNVDMEVNSEEYFPIHDIIQGISIPGTVKEGNLHLSCEVPAGNVRILKIEGDRNEHN